MLDLSVSFQVNNLIRLKLQYFLAKIIFSTFAYHAAGWRERTHRSFWKICTNWPHCHYIVNPFRVLLQSIVFGTFHSNCFFEVATIWQRRYIFLVDDKKNSILLTINNSSNTYYMITLFLSVSDNILHKTIRLFILQTKQW